MSAAHDAAKRLGTNLPIAYIEMGVPAPLAHVACEIDEYAHVLDDLDEALARKADLKLVWPRWALWLFEVELVTYKRGVNERAAVLFRRELAGDPPTAHEWGVLRTAANKLSQPADGWRTSDVLSAHAAEKVLRMQEMATSQMFWKAWEVELGGVAEAHALSADIVRGSAKAQAARAASRQRMAEKLKTLLKEAT